MEIDVLKAEYTNLLNDLTAQVDEFDFEPTDLIQVVRTDAMEINGKEYFPITKYYLKGDNVEKEDSYKIETIKLRNLMDELELIIG